MTTSTKRPTNVSNNIILFLPKIQMMTILLMTLIIIITTMIQSQHQVLWTITYDKSQVPHHWVLCHLLFHRPERKGTWASQARGLLLFMVKVFLWCERKRGHASYMPSGPWIGGDIFATTYFKQSYIFLQESLSTSVHTTHDISSDLSLIIWHSKCFCRSLTWYFCYFSTWYRTAWVVWLKTYIGQANSNFRAFRTTTSPLEMFSSWSFAYFVGKLYKSGIYAWDWSIIKMVT